MTSCPCGSTTLHVHNGPTCAPVRQVEGASPAHCPRCNVDGHYVTDHTRKPYTCGVIGCNEVAVDRHLCAAHGKRWFA